MSEAYVECLVKAKTSVMAVFFKYLLIAIAAVSFLGILIGLVLAFIPFLAAAVGVYFVNLYTDVEFEYLYLDKELTVDKVMAKSKRKRLATYSLERMEIFAPVHSYHLDSFKNRNVKEKDYSIRQVLQPDQRYAMYYEGGERVILSPSPELVKMMKNAAPRKVFSE